MNLSETDIKRQVVDYLAIRHIFNYYNLQGLGAYAGIPDRVMHYQSRVHYVEIKTPKGKLTPKQLKFQQQCMEDGVPYHVIRSVEDMIEIVSTGL